MKNPTWPKALAFIGFAIFGLALAYYSTAIATAGVAGAYTPVGRFAVYRKVGGFDPSPLGTLVLTLSVGFLLFLAAAGVRSAGALVLGAG